MKTLSAAVQFWDAFNQNFATAKASAGTTLNLPDDRYSTVR